ncbi:nucleoside deaminase [Thiocapsa rosea]|uniref:tRNA(Arg) A34 adenosine deaminase TadA n=1 Tax=Thiocapsa rosea TaxID=69360 RepID=A0A495VAZ6_9GAMM|nr:nucleoside deaminase [Thiocapsa rosea]RKT46571.1 tRNA(Arg) A34 adenosine deaminase TadA [Thiocapsa rosea]
MSVQSESSGRGVGETDAWPDHEHFMRRAITLARRGSAAGDGGPFGAVIVRDGRIIGEGWNRVIATRDPTAHGEMVAIRDACRQIGNSSLDGCALYTSGQPCPMCLGAIYWARIERVFYGFSIHDAARIGFDDHFIHEQLARPAEQRAIPEIALLREEALEILETYAANPDRMHY